MGTTLTSVNVKTTIELYSKIINKYEIMPDIDNKNICVLFQTGGGAQ